MEFELKRSIQIAPIAISFVMGCGLLKEILYYKGFDINISNYLDLSEVLMLFMPDIIYYIIITIVSLLFVFFLRSPLDEKRHSDGENAISRPNNFLTRLKGYLNFFWLIGAAIILWAALSLYFYIVEGKLLVELLFFTIPPFLWLLIFLILRLEFIRHYRNKFDKDPNGTYLNLILMANILLTYTVLSAFSEQYAIKKFPASDGVKFKFESEVISCDKNRYYIGKTANYIFLYNANESRSEVFQTKDVTYLSFPEK